MAASDTDTKLSDYTITSENGGRTHQIHIPTVHLETAGIEIGQDVGIRLVNFNGQLTFLIEDDPDTPIQRQVRESNTAGAKITLPRQAVKTANIMEEPVTYKSEGYQIAAIVNHDPVIKSPIDTYNPRDYEITPYSTGRFALYIPQEFKESDESLDVDGNAYFWYGPFGDGFLLIWETREKAKPKHSIELSITSGEYNQTTIPKYLVRLTDMAGSEAKLAHSNGQLLLKYEPPLPGVKD